MSDITEQQPSGSPELEQVDWSRFDFIDLGCSRGNSLRYCMSRFGARAGIGVDLNGSRVEQVRASGLDAVRADARALKDVDKQVRFVSMMDFLEHLPGLKAVEAVIGSCAQAATDFLFIFHPSFEGEEYLPHLGLRQSWWDWRVHTAHIHLDDYCGMFDRLGLRQYFIRPVKRIRDSSHDSILPVSAEPNQSRYDPERHDPKPAVEFAHPLWRAQEIFVALRPMAAAEWDLITRPRRFTRPDEGAAG